MNLLLIDTSKREALIALVTDGAVVAKRQWQADPKLGVRLLQEIDELLRDQQISLGDIDRIAVHAGPGHFSALRTGIVTATMLAQGTDVELVQVSGDSIKKMIKAARESVPLEIVKPVYE